MILELITILVMPIGMSIAIIILHYILKNSGYYKNEENTK